MTTPCPHSDASRRPGSGLGPVLIAPAPASNKPTTTTTTTTTTTAKTTPTPDRGPDSPGPPLPYACQPCVRRKVKCDRVFPTCSSCTKAKLECLYRPPAAPRPRRRKRSPSSNGEDQDLRARLERYERTLHDNGLLSASDRLSYTPAQGLHDNVQEQPDTGESSAQQPIHAAKEPSAQASCSLGTAAGKGQPLSKESTAAGKLLSGDGKSRYINSRIWLDAGEVDIAEMSEDRHDEDQQHDPGYQGTPNAINPVFHDPVSGALLRSTQNLVACHPSPEHASKLWATHVANVEPLCKVLHIPTTARMISAVTQEPGTATRAQECLLFSVYLFAIFSLADEDCQREFGQPRSALLAKYQYAVRQALVNALWLRTTDMVVLQAYVLFLIAMRTQIDPHTFWIMTGIAVRIAQRMGLHRDGESLNLSPYDVQIRRRLFWQLVPLDSYAGQLSGTGIAISPGSWDTKKPLNINDDQIYPGMTYQPEKQKGASDMFFCLARAELSNFYTRTGVKTKDIGPTIDLRESSELDRLIDETEEIIETKYLRYCNIVNPLHCLTLGVVRSSANVVRLRNRIAPLMRKTISDDQRRELCALAFKIVDTDSALYRDPNLKKFHWQIKAHFLWDSLICVLMSLSKPGFFSGAELDENWARMAEVYSNHHEIMEGKGAIQASIRKATLKAWRANPPSQPAPEPPFISMLRLPLRKTEAAGRGEDTTAETTPSDAGATEALASLDALFGNVENSALMDFDFDFTMNAADCISWGQFTQSQGQNFD